MRRRPTAMQQVRFVVLAAVVITALWNLIVHSDRSDPPSITQASR